MRDGPAVGAGHARDRRGHGPLPQILMLCLALAGLYGAHILAQEAPQEPPVRDTPAEEAPEQAPPTDSFDFFSEQPIAAGASQQVHRRAHVRHERTA